MIKRANFSSDNNVLVFLHKRNDRDTYYSKYINFFNLYDVFFQVLFGISLRKPQYFQNIAKKKKKSDIF